MNAYANIENIFSIKQINDNKFAMIKERIIQLLESKGIPKEEFYAKIGMTSASFRGSAKNRPLNSNAIENILSEIPDVNSDWLLTGKGKMLKGNLTEVAKADRTSDLFAEIPVVDISMAAGDGFLNGDFVDVSDFILLPKSWIKDGRLYLCGKIKGDSMHPTLQNDSYLIMYLLGRQEWGSVKDGYIYVLSARDGRTVVKRVKNRLKEHGFIVCSSDNPDKLGYPNFNIEEEEINTVWYAEWYISAKMPNIHETYYEKQSKLEDKVDDIMSEFEQIKKSIKRLSS